MRNLGERMNNTYFDTEKKEAFRQALIAWYLEHKRILPWREDTDPYRIWVSEIMLQQTRVDTVIPYFERFMTRFKTMKDFAYADENAILKIWEGLGYYSRVRNLQTAMRQVIEEHNGIVPNTKKAILGLKGVGPYTAGAILSIAYQKAEPAIDGNVMRVMSRVCEIDADIMKPSTRKIFETVLYDLIDPIDPASFNQGLMEIGALVCTPKKPMCLLCPLQSFCLAHQNGRELDYPVKIKKVKTKKIQLLSIIALDKQRILVEQRQESGLLANLFQFPTVEVGANDNREMIKLAFLKKYGFEVELKDALPHVKHIFSHLVWEVDVMTAKVTDFIPQEKVKFVSLEEMSELAFPVPYQKMWQSFIEEKGNLDNE